MLAERCLQRHAANVEAPLPRPAPNKIKRRTQSQHSRYRASKGKGTPGHCGAGLRLAPRLRDTSAALSFLHVFLPKFASPLPSNQTRGQLRLPPAPHRSAAQHSTTGPADGRT